MWITFIYPSIGDIHKWYLSLEGADDVQSNFVTKLKIKKIKGKKLLKKSFLNNLGLFFSATKTFLITFRLFLIKKIDKTPTRETTPGLIIKPTKHKKLKLK